MGEGELHAFLKTEVKGQLHAPAALLPRKGPRYPLDRGLDWP